MCESTSKLLHHLRYLALENESIAGWEILFFAQRYLELGEVAFLAWKQEAFPLITSTVLNFYVELSQ